MWSSTNTHPQPSHSQMLQTKHWNPSLRGLALWISGLHFCEFFHLWVWSLDLPRTPHQPLLPSVSHHIHPTQPLIPSPLPSWRFVSQSSPSFRRGPLAREVNFHQPTMHAPALPHRLTNVYLLFLNSFSHTPLAVNDFPVMRATSLDCAFVFVQNARLGFENLLRLPLSLWLPHSPSLQLQTLHLGGLTTKFLSDTDSSQPTLLHARKCEKKTQNLSNVDSISELKKTSEAIQMKRKCVNITPLLLTLTWWVFLFLRCEKWSHVSDVTHNTQICWLCWCGVKSEGQSERNEETEGK